MEVYRELTVEALIYLKVRVLLETVAAGMEIALQIQHTLGALLIQQILTLHLHSYELEPRPQQFQIRSTLRVDGDVLLIL